MNSCRRGEVSGDRSDALRRGEERERDGFLRILSSLFPHLRAFLLSCLRAMSTGRSGSSISASPRIRNGYLSSYVDFFSEFAPAMHSFSYTSGHSFARTTSTSMAPRRSCIQAGAPANAKTNLTIPSATRLSELSQCGDTYSREAFFSNSSSRSVFVPTSTAGAILSRSSQGPRICLCFFAACYRATCSAFFHSLKLAMCESLRLSTRYVAPVSMTSS